MDAVILSRLQFALTVMFYYLFPPLTIGLGGFLVLWEANLIKERHVEMAQKCLASALIVAAIASVAMLISGDSSPRMVARYQPAKLAAMEGLFHTTEGGTPIRVFGIPDPGTKTVHFNVQIPGLLSFLVHRDFNKPVPGLDQFGSDIPPIELPFFAFHVMVALGFYFIALTLFALWRYRKGTLFRQKWLLWIIVYSVIGPVAAKQMEALLGFALSSAAAYWPHFLSA